MKTYAAPVFLAAAASAATYSATLGGGMGTVTWVTEDTRGVTTMTVDYNTTGADSTNCPDGFNYHVHTMWTPSTLSEVDNCGSDFTGGHYIPNRMCDSISFPGADCAASQEIQDCEVGDLSSRFAPLPVDATGSVSYTDYWSNPTTFADRSVVVHCGAPRVACGKIVADATATDEVGAGGATVVADFGAWGSFTVNGDSGQIMVAMTIPAENATDYPDGYEFSYHIHEKWDNADADVAVLDDCGSAFTGGHFDPLWACGPASQYSSNDACTTCVAANNTYSCTASSAPYECEAGDLSGRFGKLTVASGALTFESNEGEYFLNNMRAGSPTLSIVLHGTGGARIACAKLAAQSDPSSVAVFAPSVLVGLLALFF